MSKMTVEELEAFYHLCERMPHPSLSAVDGDDEPVAHATVTYPIPP
jgi:hypothetical protein